MKTKYIFVTGGVCSSLGKGIACSSIGAILEANKFKISMTKIDPYLNVDAGTMSPFQHGEVYVTDDGTETDLDLGNYERFTNISLNKTNSITTGQVYNTVINRERKFFTLEEMRKIVNVCHNAADAKDASKKLYSWFKNNRGDVLIDIGIGHSLDPALNTMYDYIIKRYTVKK